MELERCPTSRSRLWWGRGTIVILALAILLYERGAARGLEPGIVVTQTEFGDRWPFPTKPEGVLRCEQLLFGGILIRPVVTITFGTEVYGMNGAAVEYGYRDWQELVLRDKLTGAYAGAPWALVALGLPLCDG